MLALAVGVVLATRSLAAALDASVPDLNGVAVYDALIDGIYRFAYRIS